MKTIKLISIATTTIICTACSQSNDDLQHWMVMQSANMQGKVNQLPPVTPYIPTAYIGRDMTDPFTPKKATKATANAPDAKRKKDYLEGYSLDQLAMVGSIKRKGVLWGLIKTPEGTINMVKPGDYIGQNFGKIIGINDGTINLQEAVLDPQGDWIERSVDVKMPSTSK